MKVKLKDLMQEGFRIAGDHSEKNILAIPIRLTDEPLAGSVLVITEDTAKASLLKAALQMTPPASTMSQYRLRFSVYDGVADSRITSDKLFGIDLLLGIVSVVGPENVTLKWDEK